MKALISAAIFCMFFSSCSTMYNSGSQTISAIGSEGQEGVVIEVKTPSSSYRSKLPSTIITNPSTFNPTTITVVDKCYERTTTTVNKSITPSFWANIFNYCIGCLIDPLTGAMWKLDSNTLIHLEKNSTCKK